MTNFKKQIFSVVTASTMLVSSAMPALASTNIVISGNGAGSDNAATVSQTNTNVVTQNNNAVVTNVVNSNANTGGNDANFNTGGDVHVNTGAARTTTNVTNALNSNAASVNCCAAGNTDVLVKDNGAFTDNTVNLTKSNTNVVTQDNNAVVTNLVTSNANTGGNDANFNTGGDVHVNTSGAKTTTNVKTQANSNTAVIGGGLGAVVTPTASFRIIGNGAGSNNDIVASLANTNVIDQDNVAYVTNFVTSNANTGGNDANFNTGGDVYVNAGAAVANTSVDNKVNFNYAAADCGCLYDVLAKIEGNGAGFGIFGSESDINLTLANTNVFGQDNLSLLGNTVFDNLNTGYNDANFNTGDTLGLSDPSVTTQAAVSNTSVTNSGNMNTVGGVNPMVWELPNTNVGVSFNFAALLAYFGLSM